MNTTLLHRTRLVLLLLFVSQTGAVFAQDYLSYSLQMYVLAPDRESLSVSIAQWTDQNGGYFVERSSEAVVLRVPPHQVTALRAIVETEGGLILRFEPSTTDLRRQLDSARAAISSRQESLDRILELTARADIGATLAFEQELRSLNGEIEYYRGQEQRIVNDSRFAWVRVALTSQESSIPDFIPSSFGWINSVDLYRFLEDRS